VKTAIVMSKLSLGADDARRRLDEAGGSIADVVGGPRSG
jgi:N-acetylmuramic acid 6-phosphate (MurNAc-6-P) etherase